MFSIPNLLQAVPLALSLTFLSYSFAAAFTTTEPGIDSIDRNLRWEQAISLACFSAFFALFFSWTL